jgi:hypothetical protein
MDVIIEIAPVTAEKAVTGMRRAFLRSFGRGPFGRRLAATGWSVFGAALVHGHGADAAAAMARTAVAERNARMLLVARWSRRRLDAALDAAVGAAARCR